MPGRVNPQEIKPLPISVGANTPEKLAPEDMATFYRHCLLDLAVLVYDYQEVIPRELIEEVDQILDEVEQTEAKWHANNAQKPA